MANGGNKPQRPLRPRQGTPGAKRKRRVVIDTPRPRPGDIRSRDTAAQPKAPREAQAPIEETGPVKVASGATVKDLSAAFGVPASQIIKIMMGVGEMVTITQSLGDGAIELIAGELGREVEIKHAAGGARDRGLRGRPGGPHAAAARRDHHGPRRPRQDDAPRRDP